MLNKNQINTINEVYNSYSKENKKKAHLDLYTTFKVFGAMAVSYHQLLVQNSKDFEIEIVPSPDDSFKFKIGQVESNHYLHFIDKSGKALFAIYWKKEMPYALHPRVPYLMHLAQFLTSNIAEYMNSSKERYCEKH